jgi:hypothetical protein
MTNYFMQNFFAQKYFDPDEYFRLGVLVPTPPQPVFSGGGGQGVQPLWYTRELDCHKLDTESKDLFERVTGAWKKIQKNSHRDPLERKKTTQKEIEKIKNKDLSQLRGKIQELRDKYNNLVKAGEGDETYVKRLKTRADQLEECYLTIEARMAKLDKVQETHQKRIEALEKERKRQEKARQEHAAKISGLEFRGLETIKAQGDQTQTIESMKVVQAELRNEISDLRQTLQMKDMMEGMTAKSLLEPIEPATEAGASVGTAITWGALSAVTLAGTYFLVPDDKRFFKMVGYTGGMVMAGLAMWEAIQLSRE